MQTPTAQVCRAFNPRDEWLTPDLKALIDTVNTHAARLAHVAVLAERGEADPERQALLANIILTISEARDRLGGIKADLIWIKELVNEAL